MRRGTQTFCYNLQWLCVLLQFCSEEIKERYGESTKISREMSGSFYEIFSRVMKVFIGKRVTIPESFKRYACVLKLMLSL